MPVHYDISLYDLEGGGDFRYKGLVKIELQVKHPTNEIVLNAHRLEIHNVQLSTQGADCKQEDSLFNSDGAAHKM